MSKKFSYCPQCHKKGVHVSHGHVTESEKRAMQENKSLSLWACRYWNLRTLSIEPPAPRENLHQAALTNAVKLAKDNGSVSSR